jgi:OmpA-OmpF porin, OOP family
MKKIMLPLLTLPLLVATNAPGDYPDLEDGWKDQPEVISVITVKQVLTGMSRHQVYHVLGEPHFNEGLNARTWNYVFDLRADGKAVGDDCQFQLVYAKGRVASMAWRTESCANAAK